MSNKYDLANRLKHLVDRECVLKRKEVLITKTSAKYSEKMTNLQATIYDQWKELSVCNRQIGKLQCSNLKLQKFIEEEELRLQKDKQLILELQQEVEERTVGQVEQRKRLLEQMDRLRCLKESSNTFINLKALPDLVQGIAILEKENSSQWVPFQINPTRHTQPEAQHLIWNASQQTGVFNDEWENLICGCFRTQ